MTILKPSLINLIRGTGITGLSGMKPVSNKIIRPLLFASRQKIEDYCSDQQIPFREDKSNAETKYTRNKIRHLVIPVLKEINPSIEETLNETAEKLAGIDEIVSDYVNGIKSQLTTQNGKTVVFDIEKLIALQSGKALIFELFRPFGITGSTSGNLIRMLTGKTGGQIFTKTHRIIRNRNELIVSPIENREAGILQNKYPEDLLMVPGIVTAGIINNKADFKIPDNQNIACLDFEKIKFPVLIRAWKRGDFFFPLGMKQKKKLSDYFIDLKFSLPEKRKPLFLNPKVKLSG